MQCKDIPDLPILRFLSKNPTEWHTWLEGFDTNVTNSMPIGTPDKLVLAKMRSLINRGLVDGCACGCRGDFVITKKGLESIKND